jgi:hypothetical protein
MNPPLQFVRVAIALSDIGGFGCEFYSTVVKPYFEELRELEKEEAAGGSGWDARKKKFGVPAESQHHDSQGNSRVLA